jgi:carboxymethylenebutenolidase
MALGAGPGRLLRGLGARAGRWLERDDAGREEGFGYLHKLGREQALAGEVVSYPGVQHAFFWPGTPAFCAAARDDAWRRILELLAS